MMDAEIVRRILLGEATSDLAYKKEIIKAVLYKASDLLATGTKIIPPSPKTNLDIKYTVPGEGSADYPVPEGRVADISDITWPEIGYSLKKAQARFRITKESKIRGQSNNQQIVSMRRAAEAIAKKQDAEIIDTIVAASGGTITVAGGDEWNTADGDPETDIVNARTDILHNSDVTTAEIRQLSLLVGTAVSAALFKLQLIGNVQQSVATYLQQAYGIAIFESRDADLADDAYLIVSNMRTGEHGFYDGPAVDLVEEHRVPGVGMEWIIDKYFKSYIVPDDEETPGTTTRRICKIANVAA